MTRERLVPLIVAVALFMENMDSTVIATSLPAIAADIGSTPLELKLAITSYLLALAIFIPASGWMADRYGARTIFRTAIAVFMLGSIGCAFSQSLGHFVVARFFQGMGGAMMSPVGRLVLIRTRGRQNLVDAMSFLTMPALIGPMLGPPLGGFITTYASWHWIFFLNLPIGIAALILTLLWVENVRSGEQHGFDWLTFLLAGFASAGAVYGMEKLGSEGVSWQLPALVLVLSLLSGVAAIIAAHRNPETSLIDLESMKLKTYSLSVYGASAFRIAVSVLPFLLPLMFQIAFGLNAFQSGLYLLALFSGDLTMKVFVIQALRRFGFRRLLIVNGIITAGSMALCSLLGPGTAIVLIILILFFHGASRSMQFTCMTTLAYTEIPHSRMSRANGFLSAVMQLSMGMGVAIGAITLRLVAHARGHSAAAPQLRDFHLAMLFMAVVALGPVIDSLGLPPDAGAATSGHRLDAMP